MTKFVVFLSIFFYFLAVLFGVILYFSLDRRDLMTAGEVIGYVTITPPEAKEIQRLIDEENKLSHEAEQLQSQIVAKRGQINGLNVQIAELQKEINTLENEKKKYDKGQALAKDLLAMKPQQAVATLTEADDAFLEFLVVYAMPFMRENAQYKKFIDAVAKNNPFLSAKIGTLVAAEEERMAEEKSLSQ